MTLMRLRHGLIGLVLSVAGVVAAPRAARTQAAEPADTAADTTSLLSTVATQARLAAARLEGQAQGARGARANAGMTQYLSAVAMLTKGQFDSAIAPLRAAILLNPNSARYHGDLGYAYAGLQQWEEAGTEYTTAIRLQGANPWYYVGLGDVRANEERWQEAGANFALAKATDSTILSPSLIAAASYVYERGGNEQQLYDWSELGTRLFPNDGAPWLRLATLLRSRGDTGQGLAAIRRFRALQPDDKLGAAVYALYLFDAGKNDSAVVLARQAAQDTSLQQYASMVYLRVGARLVSTKQFDSAAAVLAEGLPITPSGLNHQRFVFYLAHANLQRIPPMFTDAAQKHDCDETRTVDSLLVSVDSSFHQTMALDSVQTSQIITNILPQLRERVDQLKAQCRIQ
jgi:tetratricopeptide (TPR) repeat protein